jgi:ASCH domain
VKVITVCQPWAWAIVHGPKRIENRTWRTAYRGPLLIHAGKSRRSLNAEDAASWPARYGVELPGESELVFGAIIGRVDVVDCVSIDAAGLWPVGGLPFAEGPWCWILENSVAFDVPFFCSGQTLLWQPPAGFRE